MRGRRLHLIEQQQRRLYAEPAPSPGMVRLAALERVVADLQRRLQALEGRQSEPLLEVNVARKAEADRLDEAIEAILIEHRDATGKECLRALERSAWSPLPSVRTVQRHMDALRQRQTARGARETSARCQKL